MAQSQLNKFKQHEDKGVGTTQEIELCESGQLNCHLGPQLVLNSLKKKKAGTSTSHRVAVRIMPGKQLLTNKEGAHISNT